MPDQSHPTALGKPPPHKNRLDHLLPQVKSVDHCFIFSLPWREPLGHLVPWPNLAPVPHDGVGFRPFDAAWCSRSEAGISVALPSLDYKGDTMSSVSQPRHSICLPWNGLIDLTVVLHEP